MSEEPKNLQEASEKNTDRVQAAKETVKNIACAAANKADELYNKLPLDKINEKFKGKVNVKSRKFKIVFACIIGLLFLFILNTLFSGSSNINDFPVDYFEYVELGNAREGKSIRIIGFNEDEDVWNKYGGNVYVPHEINGLKVVDLSYRFLANAKFIKTLTFAEGYTELPEIILGDKIEAINLPKSIKKIPFRFVDYCHSLKELNIPKNADVKITFSNLNYDSVYYKDVEIPFLSETQIESLTLPDCWKYVRISSLPYRTLKELNCSPDTLFYDGDANAIKFATSDLLKVLEDASGAKYRLEYPSDSGSFKDELWKMLSRLVFNGKKLGYVLAIG